MSYVLSIIHLRTLCKYFQFSCLSKHAYFKSRATGVTTSVVENMEKNFKKDVLRELREGNGRILLHDEVEERPGVFSIIPIWEVVEDHEIMTPRDVIDLITNLGYRVPILLSEGFTQHSSVFVRLIMAESQLFVTFTSSLFNGY